MPKPLGGFYIILMPKPHFRPVKSDSWGMGVGWAGLQEFLKLPRCFSCSACVAILQFIGFP